MRKAKGKFAFPVFEKDFVKSSFSKNNPRTCVEVAMTGNGAAIRDSKNRKKATLFFSRSEFDAFIKGVKAGEFDH
jgi:hypothetical protein